MQEFVWLHPGARRRFLILRKYDVFRTLMFQLSDMAARIAWCCSKVEHYKLVY